MPGATVEVFVLPVELVALRRVGDARRAWVAAGQPPFTSTHEAASALIDALCDVRIALVCQDLAASAVEVV